MPLYFFRTFYGLYNRKEDKLMVVYDFNNKERELHVLRVIGEMHFFSNYGKVKIDPKTEIRKDKHATWMSVSYTEGEVRCNKFWLSERDDLKASFIYEKCLKKEKQKKKEQIIKLLESL